MVMHAHHAAADILEKQVRGATFYMRYPHNYVAACEDSYALWKVFDLAADKRKHLLSCFAPAEKWQAFKERQAKHILQPFVQWYLIKDKDTTDKRSLFRRLKKEIKDSLQSSKKEGHKGRVVRDNKSSLVTSLTLVTANKDKESAKQYQERVDGLLFINDHIFNIVVFSEITNRPNRGFHKFADLWIKGFVSENK